MERLKHQDRSSRGNIPDARDLFALATARLNFVFQDVSVLFLLILEFLFGLKLFNLNYTRTVPVFSVISSRRK